MKTRIIISICVLLLVGATTAKLLSNKRTVEENIYRPEVQKKVLVEADTVALRAFTRSVTYTGTFIPNREAMITPQVYGQVRGVYFEEGDHVQHGKLLVQIDDDLLQAQRIAAEANFLNAQRNLERYENAAAGGGVSVMQVDNARLNLKTTDSQLRQINKQIAMSRITAPFAGTITLREVEPGSVVGGAPIGQITDLSQLKLEITVPESEILLFGEGKSVGIETEMDPAHPLTGTIEYIAGRADAAHNYLVRIRLTNNSYTLKAGMYGTVTLHEELNESTQAIPRTALLGSAKTPQVFVVQDGHVVLTDIQTGATNEDLVEVIQGLRESDIIVTSGQINLTNGSAVEIIK